MGDLELTHQQGQNLLNILSSRLRFPEKLGDEAFDIYEQAYSDEAMTKLRELLMSYSLKRRDPFALTFGDPTNWKIERPETCPHCNGHIKGGLRAEWTLIDPDKLHKISVGEIHEEGLYRVLLLMAHPKSQIALNLAAIQETAWPIARKMAFDKMLMRDLKFDPTKGRRILRNDHSDFSKKSKPVKEEVKSA